MTSGLAMRETATQLAAAGFRVIVPDLRGAGASTTQHGDFSLERYVDDLLAVLDALQVTKCAVVGHSMGGQIASLLAITDPERVTKQVLVSPVPASGLPLPEDALGLFRSAPNNPRSPRHHFRPRDHQPSIRNEDGAGSRGHQNLRGLYAGFPHDMDERRFRSTAGRNPREDSCRGQRGSFLPFLFYSKLSLTLFPRQN